jgi:uncharacterized protein YdaT
LKKLVLFITVLAIAGAPILDAHAAGKKKPGSRSDYSKEQQAKFFKDALKACRAYFKSEIVNVHVDYVRRRYTCRGY